MYLAINDRKRSEQSRIRGDMSALISRDPDQEQAYFLDAKEENLCVIRNGSDFVDRSKTVL